MEIKKAKSKRQKAADLGRIGVLMGGPSSEREISLKSGKAVCEAFKFSGLDFVAIDIKKESVEENINLIGSQKIDCAFIALHGRFGEDGKIQEILEKMNLPYTGSGVDASRLAMDKIASREIFESAGLNVPRYKALEKNFFLRDQKPWEGFGLPLVIKPATQGSSIGLSIVDKELDLENSIELAFSFDDRIVIEEYIEGRELTVGVLEDKALPVIEIIPKNSFFDFEAKYQSDLTEYVVPAKLEKAFIKLAQNAAQKAHKLLGCFGCSRADLILDEKGKVFVLEVNTIPGLTSKSLLPKAAHCVGIEFNELCVKLIRLAYEKNRTKASG